MNVTHLKKDPVGDLASHLQAMTVDEVFAAMEVLENESERTYGGAQVEVLARIGLIQDEIECRFPGQGLARYRDWKKSRLLP